MRRVFFSIFMALLLTAGIAVYIAYHRYNESVELGTRTVSVVIERGNTLKDVARQLLDAGVIKSRSWFIYPGQYRGIDKRLIPGRYDFTGRNSCRSVLNRLEAGDFLRIKLTVPEGVTIWKVASLLKQKMEHDSVQITALNADSAFLTELQLPSLEGYLHPETYFFPWGITEKEALTDMVRMFHAKTDAIWPSQAAHSLSRYEILILASIIEAETGQVDERKLVSSVYHNRLNKKMKLDADPTVIYGLGGLSRPLYKKDLRKDTPYNTYLRRGLPPTPINSPGLPSILAALHPDSTDYLFFVAQDSGRHYFSRTNAEHNRAIQRARAGKN